MTHVVEHLKYNVRVFPETRGRFSAAVQRCLFSSGRSFVYGLLRLTIVDEVTFYGEWRFVSTH